MKKQKFKLNELNVKSFTTSPNEIKGGISTECETMRCNTRDYCPTLLAGNNVGFCDAPTKNCPTVNRC